MLCFNKFVVLLVLPSLALAKGGSSENGCKNEAVSEAGKKFSECFNLNVNKSLGRNTEDCTKMLDTIKDFVIIAKDKCYIDSETHNDTQSYHDFLQFSLKHQNYREFVENNGVSCINEAKDNIYNCLKAVKLGSNKTTDMSDSLWKNTKWTYAEYACNEAKSIKECTLAEIRREKSCRKLTVNNILYVRSLFDYVLEPCYSKFPRWDHHPEDHKRGGSDVIGHLLLNKMNLTQILLAVVLTLALVGTLYVVVRDCRTSGQWKKLSEQIEMKQVAVTQAIRRRSLANKDRIHEH